MSAVRQYGRLSYSDVTAWLLYIVQLQIIHLLNLQCKCAVDARSLGDRWLSRCRAYATVLRLSVVCLWRYVLRLNGAS